jgi:hypothetical protein
MRCLARPAVSHFGESDINVVLAPVNDPLQVFYSGQVWHHPARPRLGHRGILRNAES